MTVGDAKSVTPIGVRPLKVYEMSWLKLLRSVRQPHQVWRPALKACDPVMYDVANRWLVWLLSSGPYAPIPASPAASEPYR